MCPTNSKEYSHEYYLLHQEQVKRQSKSWIKQNHRHWNELMRLIVRQRYEDPERRGKILKSSKKWRATPSGKIKTAVNRAKRKNFPTSRIVGFPQENWELAHLTPEIAVFLPRNIHRAIKHSLSNSYNMKQHIEYVLNWLKENEPLVHYEVNKLLIKEYGIYY